MNKQQPINHRKQETTVLPTTIPARPKGEFALTDRETSLLFLAAGQAIHIEDEILNTFEPELATLLEKKLLALQSLQVLLTEKGRRATRTGIAVVYPLTAVPTSSGYVKTLLSMSASALNALLESIITTQVVTKMHPSRVGRFIHQLVNYGVSRKFSNDTTTLLMQEGVRNGAYNANRSGTVAEWYHSVQQTLTDALLGVFPENDMQFTTPVRVGNHLVTGLRNGEMVSSLTDGSTQMVDPTSLSQEDLVSLMSAVNDYANF